MDDRDDVKPDCRPVYRWTADSRLVKSRRCEPAAATAEPAGTVAAAD